jgi:O-antigen ligase
VVVLRSSKTLTLVLVAALLTSPAWVPADMKERILSTQQTVEDTDDTQLEGSAQLRLDTWSVILKVVSEHPIDGVGYLGLSYVLPQEGAAQGIHVKDTAHNTFLRMLGELGVFGLLLFCFILWKCWRLGENGMKAATDQFDRQLSLGLVGRRSRSCSRAGSVTASSRS